MKIHIFLFVFGLGCLFSLSEAQCDLKDKEQDVDFPDITKSIADSYIMGVEYSVPGATQTDYYTEYYELTFKRGRVESHIAGQNQVYIYQSETWEAWTIDNKTCTLKNTTITPEFFKDEQTDWLHFTGSENPTTIGPSAMLKAGLDAWKVKKADTMAYMGTFKGYIRGEQAVRWRRCMRGDAYVDYFFADLSEENPFDSDTLRKYSPLRIVFNGVSTNPQLAQQVYDIISFQHFIPKGVEPFKLPRGRNCERGELVDGPLLPDFSDNSILLNSEAVYKKLNKDNDVMSSYYSTLLLALDRETNHVAYYYSAWNSTKPDQETKEPFVDAPEYVIYDITHMYAYKINYETGQCEISRDQSFIPEYKLPEKGGRISLTDPYVLFPNSELKFLTEGQDRGIPVNIFEAEIKDYMLDTETKIPRAIFSHSYLKPNEEIENTVAVRNAPTQMESHLFRKPDEEEILTFNVFGFTTRIPRRRLIFDVTRCFKNDDDYLFLTIGFEIENQYLERIEKALPEIEENVVEQIITKSDLNPVRMPSVLTDFKDNYVYVTLVILGKPPLMLDFIDMEKDKTIKTASADDTQGVADFDTCANNCLEQRSNCWGFSMCGATCYYGSDTNTVVEAKTNCTLYRRYSNNTYMLSKESQANNIVSQVEAGEFMVMAVLGDDRVTLTATVAEITDPAEDDTMFEKMGNLLNPRMRVMKAGAKLKKGSTVKNLGKLRYDECQSLCLDFKNCETLSYCLKNSECIISNNYESDIKADDIESNDLCILLARKYTDNFDRTPGVFVETEVGTKKDLDKVEDCARACLKENGFKCLSFDHCAGGDKKGCSLYTVHYLNPNDRKNAVKGKNPRCGHYTRKFSTEFKRKDTTRIVGSKVPPITNLTLEECAKRCVEYGDGTCFGYDFCQDKTLYATSCTIIDSDPSRMESSYSPICSNYLRTEAEYAPHPFSTGKFSTEFKRKDTTRIVGSKVPPITNLTLEECAKRCVEYGDGTCFGYDFCQDKTLYATSCTIIDSDPSRMESSYSPICSNYLRTEAEYAPHPFSTGYAGGIGFLCFVVGGVIGAIIVFVVAYIRANRG